MTSETKGTTLSATTAGRPFTGAVPILATLLSTACVGSETGNAQVYIPEQQPVVVEMTLSELLGGTESLVAAGRDGEELEVTSAVAQVATLEFFLTEGQSCTSSMDGDDTVASFAHPWCKSGDRLRIDGQWSVDLLTGRFAPPLEGLELPEVSIEAVKVHMKPVDGLSAFAFAGSYELDGNVITYAFELNGAVPAGFRLEPPLQVTDELWGIGLQLGFERWFEGLDLKPCLESGSRRNSGAHLQLDAATNGKCNKIANAVRAALVSGAKANAKKK